LTATTGSAAFAAGQESILGVTVVNISPVFCTRDVSGGLQVFAVYSAAGARIWSTSDCFPGTGTDVRTLAPGETLQYNIKWSGTTSNAGCTADRLQVPAGQYQLRVAIGSLNSTPVNFTLN